MLFVKALCDHGKYSAPRAVSEILEQTAQTIEIREIG